MIQKHTIIAGKSVKMSSSITASACRAATVASVANEFLSLGEAEPHMPCIDQMKLQKLLFYAHGWYLAYKSMPLFEEDFEAWPWGPIVRDVYSQTKAYGRNPVTGRLREISKVGKGPLDFSFCTPNGVQDPEIKEFLKNVWDSHKTFTGIQLSNATHMKGEPWTIVKEQYGNLDHKPTIPNDLIASVFKGKLKNVENTSAV